MQVWLSGVLPKTVIVPDSSGRIPAIARNSVLLPAPFGPTTATESPRDRAKEIDSRAVVAPRRTQRSLVSSTGLAGS